VLDHPYSALVSVVGAGVRVITDSTSYMPVDWPQRYGIDVVPVQVIVAGQPYDETDADQAERVARALHNFEDVTTSRPAPDRFTRAIAQAAQQGASSAVIITLSSALSATHDSAVIAAREAVIPVTVVDSRSIAMGLGLAVRAAAIAAQRGEGPEVVAGIAQQVAQACSIVFYVDTLEYLRRGGRIGNARAAVGHALQVKPLLGVQDGQVVERDRVRTATKAMQRMVELAQQAASTFERPCIVVQHLDAAARARDLVDTLRSAFPDDELSEIIECPVGGVVGAHVGPGMVAVVVGPAEL
jgi:DegV family protein with EDD domain